MKKKIILGSTITLGTALILGLFSFKDTAKLRATDSVYWNHYAAVEATETRHGSREFWANCSTHTFSLTLPDSDNIHEGVAFDTTTYFFILDDSDARYIAPTGGVLDVDGKRFDGTDLLEKDFEYYESFKEVTTSQFFEFIDSSNWTMTSLKASGGDTVVDMISYLKGTYVQNGTNLSLTVTHSKNPSNPDWMEVPPGVIILNAIVDGATIIIENSTPSSQGMVTVHSVYSVVAE